MLASCPLTTTGVSLIRMIYSWTYGKPDVLSVSGHQESGPCREDMGVCTQLGGGRGVGWCGG